MSVFTINQLYFMEKKSNNFYVYISLIRLPPRLEWAKISNKKIEYSLKFCAHKRSHLVQHFL